MHDEPRNGHGDIKCMRAGLGEDDLRLSARIRSDRDSEATLTRANESAVCQVRVLLQTADAAGGGGEQRRSSSIIIIIDAKNS
jgi:hypothetical protein